MRLFLISLLLIASAPAHTDLSTTIKALSAKITANPTADLYYQRATEYRALRERDHAIQDLRKALELNQKYRDAQFALAEILAPSDEALNLTLELTNHPGPPPSLAPTILLAKIHQMRGELEQAFEICRRLHQLTLNTRKNDTEIDLLYADILLELNRPADAATSLQAAWKRTDSIVLRNNWIDTALTADQSTEVLPIIERELHSSRLRSSWLIRRARALLILGKKEAALTDLRSALLEIQPRIDPTRPDLTLITDRGLIHALMNNPALARQDLALLEKSGLPPSSYRLLSKEVPAASKKPK